MSGGHFDGDQYRIGQIAETIESIIYREEDLDYDGFKYAFTEKTLLEFRAAVTVLKMAEVYAQRVDYLMSGDDSEETFHKRLKKDLRKI